MEPETPRRRASDRVAPAPELVADKTPAAPAAVASTENSARGNVVELPKPRIRVVTWDDLTDAMNRHARPFLPDSIAAKLYDLPQFEIDANQIVGKHPVNAPGAAQAAEAGAEAPNPAPGA